MATGAQGMYGEYDEPGCYAAMEHFLRRTLVQYESCSALLNHIATVPHHAHTLFVFSLV
jgi:hypothetical protein